MNRVQQGHQQVLIGQNDGSFDVVGILFISPHRLHESKSLLGLSHIGRHSHHTHLGRAAIERLQLFGTKSLAIAIDEQCSGVMRRLVELLLNARIIPPEVGLSGLIEAVKQLDLGNRQHTKAHKHQPGISVHVDVLFGRQPQLSARRNHPLLPQCTMILRIDGMQGIPQAHKFLFDSAFWLFSLATSLPQVGIGTGVEKCGEQARSEYPLDRLLHLGRQIVAAQAVQAIEVAVDFPCIGHRAVDVVKVADNELGPIDELIKRLRPVAHRLAIGIIEGEHHLNVGGNGGTGQLGDQVIDGRHPRQQMRLDRGCSKFPLHIVGEELTATTIGKDETIVLKTLSLKVISCHLLEKRFHNSVVSS